MRRLSNIRVRNVATIGGNLAHGDPHMDLPPVLIALGARVTVAGPRGNAACRSKSLFAGYFETVLAQERADRRAAHSRPGPHARGLSQGHHRFGRGLAGTGGSRCARNRWAATSNRRGWSSAPRPRRRSGCRAAEQALAGAPSTIRTLARAGDAAAEQGECISDVRGSAAYKRELVRVYVRRAVRQALERNGAIKLMAKTTTVRSAARSAARCRASRRERRSPDAPSTPTPCGCRACCMAKIFRSTLAHGRIRSIDVSAALRRCPASTASSPPRTCAR